MGTSCPELDRSLPWLRASHLASSSVYEVHVSGRTEGRGDPQGFSSARKRVAAFVKTASGRTANVCFLIFKQLASFTNIAFTHGNPFVPRRLAFVEPLYQLESRKDRNK
ncbi:uncharacterized protein PITG_11568 [Phytophthora infestans T30-4]|uniref:Uncharacterized protein n=1 Tax=Phytophthora infestans (strain T30-4) TaxID=403677 RepID=D0NI24_PHYIT|nr:uncharacterized protein PITG_11568 [Phytophthora infestans T30-4]EEY59109.1 hypothetical protein PITG_11568 [Phytophthora infestans T30-4]|eukprot:XP_002901123.1 hypothetical protein PITG_11568 [Phytophthora infestans T30-4]